mgnify:CR=1 FL=1
MPKSRFARIQPIEKCIDRLAGDIVRVDDLPATAGMPVGTSHGETAYHN